MEPLDTEGPLPPGWVVGPVGWAIQYVAQETAQAALIHRSLGLMEGHKTMIAVYRKLAAAHDQKDLLKTLDLFEKELDGLDEEAAKLRETGYDQINSHALVAIWGAVEVAVEDTVVGALRATTKTLEDLQDGGYKVKLDVSTTPSEAEARKLYRSLEGQTKESMVANRWSILLRAVGVPISDDGLPVELLEEVNQLRNCILHRGGIIDRRAAEKAPGLSDQVGTKIVIDQDRYLEYYGAVTTYLIAMAEAATKSKHLPTDD